MYLHTFRLKEVNHGICDHMDEPGGHHAEWNKSAAKGHITYDSTYMEYLK